MARPVQIVFDCADPAALAAFWATALGYEMQAPPEGFASWEDWLREHGVPESEWNSRNAVVDPDGVGPRVFFQRVPEPKTGKVRIHLDLGVSGGPGVPIDERRQKIDAEAARLVGLGAEIVGAFEQQGEYWVGMRDPEGHEFDVQ